MSIDREQFIERACDYVEREADTEVTASEFIKETSSIFGEDVILSMEITDEEESECWVIGGTTPMNLYPKSQFNRPEEAYQFHFGTISRLLQDEMQKEDPQYPDWVGYDAFICHASEDKAGFVRPLAETLSNKDLRIWYDEFELSVGDSLRESIDRGLSKSAYGIVVLSEAFFNKEWTQYELNGLTARETEGEKIILPIWYNIDKQKIMDHSPPLADKVGVLADKNSVEKAAEEIYEAIMEDAVKQIANQKQKEKTD